MANVALDRRGLPRTVGGRVGEIINSPESCLHFSDNPFSEPGGHRACPELGVEGPSVPHKPMKDGGNGVPPSRRKDPHAHIAKTNLQIISRPQRHSHGSAR